MVGNLRMQDWITYMLQGGNFWAKKKLSEPIYMGSSFENLVATSLTVKTDSQSDKRFVLRNFLNFGFSHLMRDDISLFVCLCMHAKGAFLFAYAYANEHAPAISSVQIYLDPPYA